MTGPDSQRGRITRTYVDAPLAPGVSLPLPEAAAGHLLRVLRLRAGDACVLFNGDGHDYQARIATTDRRGGTVQVDAAVRVDNESSLRILLLQGIARGEKMDWVLQKATELGVAGFFPASSERSEVRLDASRAEKRLAHWRSVVVSACEQSGRARLPEVSAPLPLAAAVAALPPEGPRFLLDPFAERGIGGLELPPSSMLVLAVGPEGGWSPRDREILQASGFTGLRMGPRVLRTETAGIAAVAALQVRLGDCGD